MLSVGKTLGFTRVELRDAKDRIVAFGRASVCLLAFARAHPGGAASLTTALPSPLLSRARADHTKFIGRAANAEVRRQPFPSSFSYAADCAGVLVVPPPPPRRRT